jgi:hypothetical protein
MADSIAFGFSTGIPDPTTMTCATGPGSPRPDNCQVVMPTPASNLRVRASPLAGISDSLRCRGADPNLDTLFTARAV